MHACMAKHTHGGERSIAYLWKAIAHGEHRAWSASILPSCSPENKKQTNRVKQNRTNNIDRFTETETNRPKKEETKNKEYLNKEEEEEEIEIEF